MSTALAFTLRALRKQAGLSQNRLAQLTSIDVAYICRIEQGKQQNLSLHLTQLIAKALGLDTFESDRLMVAAGHWPWSLSPEDTRLLLEIGGKIAQAAEPLASRRTGGG